MYLLQIISLIIKLSQKNYSKLYNTIQVYIQENSLQLYIKCMLLQTNYLLRIYSSNIYIYKFQAERSMNVDNLYFVSISRFNQFSLNGAGNDFLKYEITMAPRAVSPPSFSRCCSSINRPACWPAMLIRVSGARIEAWKKE